MVKINFTAPVSSQAALEKKYQTRLKTGLKNSVARRRIKTYGANTLAVQKKKPLIYKFVSYFFNPLTGLLGLVAVALLVIGDYLEASLVWGMVIISGTLDFWQEYKADQAVEKLQLRVAQVCEVRRQGERQNIWTKELVPGDILLLNAGDMIPADGVIMLAKDFYINQASLTGESQPVEKWAVKKADWRQNPQLDQINEQDLHATYLVFSGTSVSTGQAEVLVTQTGLRSQFGKIAQSLTQTEAPSHFITGINQFSKSVLKIVLLTVLGILGLYLLNGRGVMTAVTFSIAVAAGITPDFLAIILSLCMSKGAKAMAEKGVIVKRLTAMPNLGSTEILCTDKTGTITQDQITLIKHTGIFGQNDDQVLLFAQLNSGLQSGLTDEIDKAVMAHYVCDLKRFHKVDELPFDYERKGLSVIVDDQVKKQRWLVLKGAYETTLAHSKYYCHQGKTQLLTADIKRELALQHRLLSEDGFRVLAVARKKLRLEKKKTEYDTSSEQELEFLGFISLLDPVKDDAQKMVSDLKKIGVTVKVITGDNEIVTRQTCAAAGIVSKEIILGSQIETLTDQQLAKQALEVNIFARFTPGQKERLIRVLKNQGHPIAYLGDGINDAPSLNAADVGISVDNAVDVAREAADIILTRKSLDELRLGIVIGRKTFVNTMKYIKVGMSSSLGNVISFIVAAFALPFLPMLPLQVLLNDFLYDMSQLALASDNVSAELVTKPQRWSVKEVWRFILFFGPLSCIFDLGLFFVMTKVWPTPASQFQTTWFIYSLSSQLLALFLMRDQGQKVKNNQPAKSLVIVSLLMLIGGLAIILSPVGQWFGFSWPNSNLMWVVLGSLVGYVVIIQIGKKLFYRQSKNRRV